MDGQEPDVKPFDYCLVPCDGERPVELRKFTGNSDQEVRDLLSAYFGEHGITGGQTKDFKEHMMGEVEKNAEKAAADAPKMSLDEQKRQAALLLEQAMQHQAGSYEIVPVTYPTAANGYIGTSLYIDQVGRFKELPLNERASKMAQRDIRGDAFVLRNYDDPIKDAWARIDCPKDLVEGMIEAPPQQALNPTAQAAAMQAQGAYTKVTPEMVADARTAKEEGNALFKKGDYAGAVAKYTAAVDGLKGRRDEVDQDLAAELERASLLNRAQCHLKLKQYTQAEQDCSTVLLSDGRVLKALFRRAQARRSTKDYDGALADLAVATEVAPGDGEVAKLTRDCESEKRAHLKKERERFAGMFAG